jgi:hypothetical protein
VASQTINTNVTYFPADLRFAQGGGDSFPCEMDVSLPKELTFHFPDGSVSQGVKPIELLEISLVKWLLLVMNNSSY